MKQILEQYASGAIAILIALTLLWVIDYAEVLGAIVQDSIGEKAIVENEVFEGYLKESILDMQVKNVYVTALEETLMSDCVEVKNRQGQIMPVVFKKVWNTDGEELHIEGGTSFCIPSAGVYWFEISSTDGNQMEHSWIVKLLVNER